MMWQDLKLYSVQERRGLCPLVLSNTIDATGRKIVHTLKKNPTKQKNPPPNKTQLEIYCFVLLHIFYTTFS